MLRRLGRKIGHVLSPRKNLRRVAFHVNRISVARFPRDYVERAEYGPSNLQMKLDRVAAGGPFEPYDVTLVNRGVAQLLGDARSILEIGCGTGMLATLAARDPERRIVASEFDDITREWVMKNRASENIEYTDRGLEAFPRDAFDLVVAVEVIEHVADYGALLEELSRVAPRTILTTPNKFRTPLDSVAPTPAFDQHVREWSAGELYWVLRAFYADVQLYTTPRIGKQIAALRRDACYEPRIEPCGLHSHEWSLIAVCTRPARRGAR